MASAINDAHPTMGNFLEQFVIAKAPEIHSRSRRKKIWLCCRGSKMVIVGRSSGQKGCLEHAGGADALGSELIQR